MNKKEILNLLITKTNRNEIECLKIMEILEEIPIIGKNNKEKILIQLSENLNYSKEEAGSIYNIFCDIIKSGLKDSIKHPFKSKSE